VEDMSWPSKYIFETVTVARVYPSDTNLVLPPRKIT
jgi:hypothetical protein